MIDSMKEDLEGMKARLDMINDRLHKTLEEEARGSILLSKVEVLIKTDKVLDAEEFLKSLKGTYPG